MEKKIYVAPSMREYICEAEGAMMTGSDELDIQRSWRSGDSPTMDIMEEDGDLDDEITG